MVDIDIGLRKESPVMRRAANAGVLAGLVAFAACTVGSSSASADPPPAHAVVAHELEPPPAEAPTVEAPPLASRADPPPPPSGPSRRVVALSAGGLAIVAAGAGTVFGVLALNNKSTFDRSPTRESADYGNEYAFLCDAALGAAVLAGVTSVLLYLRKDEPAPPGATPSTSAPAVARPHAVTFAAAPVVTPHGAGAGAVLRF